MKRILSTLKPLSLILCATLLWGMNLQAVPGKRVMHTVTQPDGTQLTLLLRGDEHLHYYACTDGMPVVQDADSAYRYAIFANGTLQAGDFLAHDPDLRGEEERAWVTDSRPATTTTLDSLRGLRMARANTLRLQRQPSSRLAAPRRLPGNFNEQTYKGTFRQLVILVNYSDRNMKHTADDFNALYNQEGYSEDYHIGSVRDYFLDQSYGQLALDFDVAGPYTVSQKMSYYGKNDSIGNDKYAGALVAEACKLAEADGVDFSKYDWNGDGEMEQVIVIYAGYSEASGAKAYTIWPHQYYLSYSDYGKALTLDGTRVDAYAVFSELSGTSGSQLDGIGTFCHEYSHCLGLPDLYDTGSSGTFGMDVWSVLDYGCYNGPAFYEGSVPCAYTAYERACMDWLTPTTLSQPCQVSRMAAITDSAQAYVIYNEANPDEFYVLDNHQQTSWDTYANGHGMLITHVDYDAEAWYENVLNNDADHLRCTIIPADGATESYYDPDYEQASAGDPWPGTSGNTELTNTSTPAATLYNANADGSYFLNKPLTNIEEADGLISFAFDGGGDSDAIRDIAGHTNTGESSPALYDLTGRRVAHPVGGGLYIQNGRKVLLP